MTETKARGIIFSGENVRAILGGKKTQTRRLMKPQPPTDGCVEKMSGSPFSVAFEPLRGVAVVYGPVWAVRKVMGCEPRWRCPYGARGDRLWVRETFCDYRPNHIIDGKRAAYAADCNPQGEESECCMRELGYRWKSPLFMPRNLSRITLEITKVRAERLQTITHEDAQAEVPSRVIDDPLFAPGTREFWSPHGWTMDPRMAFGIIWDSLNGAKSGMTWKDNPWVWAVSFKRVEGEA